MAISYFIYLNRTVPCKSRGIIYKSPNNIIDKGFLHQPNMQLFNDISNALNVPRETMTAINKKYLEDISDIPHNRFNCLGKQKIYSMVLDDY